MSSRARAAVAVILLTLLGALLPSSATASDAGSAVATTRQAKAGLNLRVGSFNISQVRLDGTNGGAPWATRKPVVVGQILSEGLDVVGIQEAYQNVTPTQYAQLRDGLNSAGATYAVVDEDPKTSRDMRIVYNAATLSVVEHGYYRYAAQSGPEQNTRFLTWAIFSLNATGQQFFFSNTHLVQGNPSAAQAQWAEIIPTILNLSRGLPVIHVGDHQTGRKPGTPAAVMVPRMKAAGFGDVVGVKSGEYLRTKTRAKRLVNANIGSFNGFVRKTAGYSMRRDQVANSPDWIFASNQLDVKSWKVVAEVKKGRLVGTIPSDHFLVTSVITLP